MSKEYFKKNKDIKILFIVLICVFMANLLVVSQKVLEEPTPQVVKQINCEELEGLPDDLRKEAEANLEFELEMRELQGTFDPTARGSF